jgi:hypothetical protein
MELDSFQPAYDSKFKNKAKVLKYYQDYNWYFTNDSYYVSSAMYAYNNERRISNDPKRGFIVGLEKLKYELKHHTPTPKVKKTYKYFNPNKPDEFDKKYTYKYEYENDLDGFSDAEELDELDSLPNRIEELQEYF